MANAKKVLAGLFLLAAMFCMTLLLTACDNAQPTDPTTQTTQVPEVIYTITVKTAGGLALDGVNYYIYDSVREDDVIDFGSLKADGLITFTAPRSDEYVLKLSYVPTGYDVQEYYTLTNTKMDIVLTASVITEGNATDRVYGLGDVMTDFTVTDADGNTYTLSEILKTKEAVMLNFWYVGCGPCKQEFPHLQKAYELYGDKIEVIAMNSYPYETAEDVANFKETNGYTFPMVKVDSAWNTAMGVSSYPTSVFIDRYGVICLIQKGTVTEEGVFEGAFNHFTSENYEQKLVNKLEDLDTLEYPVGHKRNPMETYGAIGSFQIKVEAGKEFHCNIMRCDGMVLKVSNADVYVMYDNKRYDADENGIIEFELSCKDINDAAKLEFRNDGLADQSFTVELNDKPGTIASPFEMTYGQLEVLIQAGNEQGVFYTMTADKSGFIMLAVTGLVGGEKYEIQIDNQDTMQSISFNEECKADEEGVLTVAIPVSAGNKLRIVFMSMANDGNTYPETTIQALVSYSEHGGIGALEEIPYTLTFKDVEGLPMAGITATFTVNGEAVVLISNEEGVITTQLPEGSYMVQLVFPDGFTADSAQYLLTPEDPAKDVVVRLYEEKEITYTIHVQDHDGLPVPNAIVTVGNSFMRTDENGNAVFLLPVGSYKATVVPPEGYISKQDSYSFGVRPEVVIVLENNQSTTKIPYTIHIKDGYGDPYSDVVARLHAADGTIHLVVITDGVGSTNLVRGNYTVDLIFQQENMRYAQTGLLLTAEITETTIVVAPGVEGRPGKVNPTTMPGSTFDAYYLNTNHNYVDVEPLNLKFFLFKPTKPGIYKIWTNNPGAEVENWQTLDQATPLDAGVENNILVIEVEEVGKTYVIGIDAAYDVSEIILTVFRVPDCVLDPLPVTPDLPVEPYAPHLPEYAEIRYLNFMAMQALVLGEDGFFHLDTEDGPIVLIDLKGNRYGVSLQMLMETGEMAWYEYDRDGYPIYKRDYTECMNAYLAVMEPVNGLYPLTMDLYTMIKDYGDHIGWWDPASENFLFTDMEDGVLIPDAAWMFLACYIYIDPALCQHEFTDWTLDEGKATMIRTCPYCRLAEEHKVGEDCGMNTADTWVLNPELGAYTAQCTICHEQIVHKIQTDCNDATCEKWVLNGDGTAYERLCLVCFSQLKHQIGIDCAEEHLSQWVASEDGLGFECTCAICAAVHRHITGTDCADAHFGAWTPAEDGLGFVRSCSICGGTQTHITGTDCQDAHYGQWQPSQDGTGFERKCTICGAVQFHATGIDCNDATCGQWQLSKDRLNFERTCQACGNVQLHITGKDCTEDTYGPWTLSEDGTKATRVCNACGRSQIHWVGSACKDHYGAWILSEDGTTATRSCTICGKVETHTAINDCAAHYGQWIKAEDGSGATRACAICGHTETHQAGAACESNFSAWVTNGDGTKATRTCSICGKTEEHEIGTDCAMSAWTANGEGTKATRTCSVCGKTEEHNIDADCQAHYGQWSDCEDGVNQQRTCTICGHTEKQPRPQDPVIPPEEPNPEPDPENPEGK